MVKPNIASRNTICGRGSVKHETAQTVYRLTRVGPATVAHQILCKIAVVAAQAAKTLWVREISCSVIQRHINHSDIVFSNQKLFNSLPNKMFAALSFLRLSTMAAKSTRATFGREPAVAESWLKAVVASNPMHLRFQGRSWRSNRSND